MRAASLTDVQIEVSKQLHRDYGMHPIDNVRSLCLFGLTEEAGEVAGLEKRRLRHNDRDDGKFDRERYVDELGDVLWYLTACCSVVGTSLDEIWEKNKEKLEERYG